MGLTLDKLKLMVDSGDFQWHTSTSTAKALIGLRNNFAPDMFVKTHGHVDHVIGTLYQQEFGNLPKSTNFITSQITAEQLRTVFMDSLGLQIRKQRAAKAVNAKIAWLHKEQKRYQDLILILTAGGMQNTQEILQNYDLEFGDRVSDREEKKSVIKRLIWHFVKRRNEVPKDKSLQDLYTLVDDVDKVLADLWGYRIDYSWRMITQPTVAEVLKRTMGIPYFKPHAIEWSGWATVTLYPAGHILWSSQVLVSSPHHNILFSGDIGRIKGTPFLPGPQFPQWVRVDTAVLESTYGERLHTQSYSDGLDQIFELQRTAKGDCLTATIAYQKWPENLINALRTNARKILYFGRTLDDFRTLFMKYGGSVFQELQNTRFEFSYNIPDALGNPGSNIFAVAPSGMWHGCSNDLIRKVSDNRDARVIFTNFLPEASPGYKLVNEKKLRTDLGEIIPFKWDVFHVTGTSGHGDQNDLVEAGIRSVQLWAKTLILNHGGEQRIALAKALRDRIQKERLPQVQIVIPQNGDQIDLTSWKIVKNLLPTRD